MKIVNESAEQVEAELRKDEIRVTREPYDPRSRSSLLSDLVGFLRSPSPGSSVTLFEDESGRVRYYTVAHTNPEIAELKTQITDLTKAGAELPAKRLDQIEKRLKNVEAFEPKLAKVDELAAIAERLPEVEAKVDAIPALEAKVDQLGELRTRLDRLEKPR